ncbi:GntG family PLP-dependent aldolase [Verrucosispora sp. WMMD1129]|uniref:GntG family PLP-dependent aldolase n=1 Tax=Verrucosispora sp. WMMD1129 TaxID=3016093 RepID=UPI00249B3F44|nr:GntG family PLP-dependent aldolase [Verrucosispora sp. WMMD1129]WFE47891.1 GntG family PLP-dependent aldolase [Verrucosispora sp. WMMD1129]
MIELRSDTFTVPDATMRHAIAEAAVGDDVYGEDPTVRALERRAAALTGHQAAVFTPSGTMANLCSVMAQAERGRAVIVGDRSDLYLFEAGGPSVLGGTVLRPVPNLPDGTLDPRRLTEELTVDRQDPQFALPALLCVENTHNMAGGVPLDLGYLKHLRDLSGEHGIRLHLDGARVFNAAVALGVPVGEITSLADSAQFCLSKGLGAPVGSLLVGSAEVIERAQRIRKMLGGGMRQAGLLAAAGLIALDDVEQRLRSDHEHAAIFAELLMASDALELRGGAPRTNIVFFRAAGVESQTSFLRHCADGGVRLLELEAGWVRAVFHGGVSGADARRAAHVIRTAAERHPR